MKTPVGRSIIVAPAFQELLLSTFPESFNSNHHHPSILSEEMLTEDSEAGSSAHNIKNQLGLDPKINSNHSSDKMLTEVSGRTKAATASAPQHHLKLNETPSTAMKELTSPFKSRNSDERSNSFGDETKPFHVSQTERRLSFGSDGELDHLYPSSQIPKTASWQTAGLLMIADVVGAGVMTLATAFAQLGWVLSFLSLIFWYLVNMYVGMLVAEAREAWPTSESFQELSLHAFGKRTRLATGVAVYTFLAFVLGDYVLILGESLQMIFYESKHCSLLWTSLGAVFMLPLSQIRLLALTNGLMILNVVTIIGSIGLALGRLASMDETEMKEFRGNVTIYTEPVAKDLTLLSFFHSQALFAFAYMGVFIYLEIISEMKNPKEFKYSLLWLSGPFQFAVYAVTGALGYLLIGNKASGLLIKQIPVGTAYRLAALLLSIHMVLTFLVKGTVLSRAIHAVVSPSTAKDFNNPGAHKIYFLISLGVLFFCFLVANLIPFFDDLTSFLGALQTPFIGFILPIFFVLKARKRFALSEVSTSTTEKLFMGLIIISMIMLFFVGVVGSISNIVQKWTSYGVPFKDCIY